MKDQSRRVFGSELILLSTLGLLCAAPLRAAAADDDNDEANSKLQ